eukprot:scaffold7892_cov64-Isochrysis_galbana.AAC.2
MSRSSSVACHSRSHLAAPAAAPRPSRAGSISDAAEAAARSSSSCKSKDSLAATARMCAASAPKAGERRERRVGQRTGKAR